MTFSFVRVYKTRRNFRCLHFVKSTVIIPVEILRISIRRMRRKLKISIDHVRVQ